MSSTNGQTPAKGRHRWPLLLIAAPAAVAVWSGWVGLGQKCGFGPVHPLPGIDDGFRLNTAITLPVGMEAYGAYALGVWLGPGGVPAAARSFARRSAIGALALGMLGQVIYHLLAAAGWQTAPWPVVVMVSCLPVATLGLGAALTHLLRAGDASGEAIAEASVQASPASMVPAVASLPDTISEPSVAAPQMPAGDAVSTPAADASGEPPQDATQEPAGTPAATQPPASRDRAVRLADDPDATAARAAYRKSVRARKPLSDRALGEMYGRGRTWGANRIAEVKGGPKLAKAQ